MPKRKLVVWLEDAGKAIKEIEEIKEKVKSFTDYDSSNLHKRAFGREFEIIGEALYQIRKERPDIAITDINKIIALKHIIAHAYYDVSHEEIWRYAGRDLVILKCEIQDLIEQENIKFFGTSNPNLDE
jgi:uncharacterized protein with HEPN domain